MLILKQKFVYYYVIYTITIIWLGDKYFLVEPHLPSLGIHLCIYHIYLSKFRTTLIILI